MELPIAYQKLIGAFKDLKVTRAEFQIDNLKWEFEENNGVGSELHPFANEFFKHREIVAITLWQVHAHMDDKSWQEVAAEWVVLSEDNVNIDNVDKKFFRKIAADLLKLIKY